MNAHNESTDLYTPLPSEVILYSGEFFNFAEPEKCVFRLSDIAQSLSQQCRFNGHCKHFYSVAQHSVLCSYIVDPAHAKQALLHDAAEFVLCDIPTPLKNALPNYEIFETYIQELIYKRFGLDPVTHDLVKLADRCALAVEAERLTPNWNMSTKYCLPAKFEHLLGIQYPNDALVNFISRFFELFIATNENPPSTT